MTQHPVSDEDDGDENSEARRNTIKGFAQKIVSMMMSRERVLLPSGRGSKCIIRRRNP
jgi:hypothetical protein